jgi:hypothetical protein
MAIILKQVFNPHKETAMGSCTTLSAWILALSVHGLAASATATETESIKTLPSSGVIALPGHYQLQKDLSVERDMAIRIEANDVTLDLGGHAVRFGGMPRKGTYGVIASTRRNVSITNGSITGFWFGIHCIENQNLRINRVRFEDISYIAVSVADSRNVLISDNTFAHFRYDLPRLDDEQYLIGINMGAEDAVVTYNRFNAEYTGKHPDKPGLETVFVLLVADVSQRCVVTHNQMDANMMLGRSYGIWAGANAQLIAAHNSIRNMKYGICVDSNTTAMAGFNHLSADPPPAGMVAADTYGIYAVGAKETHFASNLSHGLTYPVLMRRKSSGER